MFTFEEIHGLPKAKKRIVKKPLFTTKHYKAIAGWVNENFSNREDSMKVAVINSLNKFFREDNPKFKNIRFEQIVLRIKS